MHNAAVRNLIKRHDEKRHLFIQIYDHYHYETLCVYRKRNEKHSQIYDFMCICRLNKCQMPVFSMNFNRKELKFADKYRDLRLLLIDYVQLYNIHLFNLSFFFDSALEKYD